MKQEEKLEEAKRLYKMANANERYMLESLFPELKELGDERVRKELIDYINRLTVTPNNIDRYNSWVTWLEKQGKSDETKAKIFLINKGYPIDANGVFPTYEEMYNIIRNGLEHQVEQKSIFDFNANNRYVSKVDGKIHNIYNVGVEPKFHKDEWVVNNATLNLCHILRVEHGQYICDDCSFPITKENEYHLWTIQDAKDGDVLATKNSIFIFQEEYIAEKPIAYCGLMNGLFIKGEDACWTNEKCYPASKEQRDTLEKAIADAGYTFDFEEKVLKKIGYEIEIPFGVMDSELQEVTYCVPKGFYAEIDDDKVVIKKGEKPIAWSKEDEHRLEDTIYFLDTAKKHYASTVELDACINWLKSLKERLGG